jgi:hypothetical protein
MRPQRPIGPQFRNNGLNLVSQLREFLAEVGPKLLHGLVRIWLQLPQLMPFVLDGVLKLTHPGRCVLLGARLDRVPISQALFKQSILPFLPEMQRKAEPIDLRLKLRQATFEFGCFVLDQLIHGAAS